MGTHVPLQRLRGRARSLAITTGAILAVGATAAVPAADASSFAGTNGPIAFIMNGGPSAGQVFIRNTDGSLTQVTNTTSYFSSPRFSPDGKSLVFIGTDPNTGIDSIYLAAATAGATPIDLSTNAPANTSENAPSFTADGKAIVFDEEDVNTFASSGIYEMTTSGTDVIQLTTGNDYRPTVSADGTQLAFTRYPQSGPSQIEVSPLSGEVPNAVNAGAPVALTTGTPSADQDDADWSPNGSEIAYDQETSTFSYDVFVAASNGTTAGTDLTPGASGQYNYHASFSPDGTEIAFNTDRTLAANNGPVGEDGIWIMNADGSNPHALLDPSNPPQATYEEPDWAPIPAAPTQGSTTPGATQPGATQPGGPPPATPQPGNTQPGTPTGALTTATIHRFAASVDAGLLNGVAHAHKLGAQLLAHHHATITQTIKPVSGHVVSGTDALQLTVPVAGARDARVHKPVVVATGARRVVKAGRLTVLVKLTRQGVALLQAAARHHRTLHLREVATFTPKGGKAVAAARRLTLKP